MSIANDPAHLTRWMYNAGRLLLQIDDLRVELSVALQQHPTQRQIVLLAEMDQDLADAQTMIVVASSKGSQL